MLKNDFQIASELEEERLNMSNILADMTKENIEFKSIHELSKQAKDASINSKQYHKAHKWHKLLSSIENILQSHLKSTISSPKKKNNKRKSNSNECKTTNKRNAIEPITIKDCHNKTVNLDDTFSKASIHKAGKELSSNRSSYGYNITEEKKSRGLSDKKSPSLVTKKMFEKSMKESWRHQGETGRDKLNQSLILENGCVFCSACTKPVVFYGIPQHICGKKHKTKLSIWNNKKIARQKTIINVNTTMKSKALIGQTLTEDIRAFRMDALHEVCKSNISVKSFGCMVPWIEQISSKSIGHICNLSDTYAPMLHHHLMEEIVILLEKCYPQFGTVNDGTPCFAKAEAVALRVVSIDTFEIHDMLVSFDLLEGKLGATQHSHNILSGIISKAKRDPKYWRPSMQDRSATNGAAVKLINSTTSYSPTVKPCCSHTLSNSGKKMSAPYADKFRKLWNKVIKFRGKATEIFKDVFGFEPTKGGGVRWYVDWEVENDLGFITHKQLLNEVIVPCVENAWSLKSSTEMKETFLGEELKCKINLAMCMLENAALRDGGKILCESTYILEGDDPLVLSVYKVFKKLDDYCENNSEMTHTNLVVEEVYGMLHLIYRPRIDNLNDTREACRNLQISIESKVLELNNIPHPDTQRRGRAKVRHDYANMVGRRSIQNDTNAHSQLDDINIEQNAATTLYEDNQGALLMANSGQPTKRTRHMDTKHFALQQWVELDLLKLKRINTADN